MIGECQAHCSDLTFIFFPNQSTPTIFNSGLQGEKGNLGERGLQGNLGSSGLPGTKGERGFNGTDGVPGVPGAKGDAGPTGIAGLLNNTNKWLPRLFTITGEGSYASHS